jgi:hypothetical protein
MAKKSYQIDGSHSSLTLTVNAQGKQVQLTPADDVYETSDPEEQGELDAVVARAGSGLKKAGK